MEHVLPQSLPTDALDEFSSSLEHARRLVHHLGNLTLAGGSENTGWRDQPYSVKVSDYAKSAWLTTRSLAGALAQHGSEKKVAALLSSAKEWNLDAFSRRHQEVGSVLAGFVLGVPQGALTKAEVSVQPKLPPFLPKVEHLAAAVVALRSGPKNAEELLPHLNGVSTMGVPRKTLSALGFFDLADNNGDRWVLNESGEALVEVADSDMSLELALVLRDRLAHIRDIPVETITTAAERRKLRDATRYLEWADNQIAISAPAAD